MAKKSSNLVTRVVTAVVSIPILLAIIFLAPPWAAFALVTFAGLVTTWEYCSMTYGDEHRPGKVVATLLSGGVAATLYFVDDLQWFLFAVAASFLVIFLLFLFTYKDQKRVTHQIGSSLTGILYGGVVLATMSLLMRDGGDAGPFWFVLVMIVVWSSDTGAYFAGRFLGKHKLYEAVSPNKTIEGSMGGLLASVGVAFLFNELFAMDASWVSMELWQVLVLAIPANLLSQVGDLCASLAKRAHEVKDSGRIFPGHGGMIDRIDGLIFAAPWFYFVLLYFVA
ncbi:MAG: phosphatidate cytidylyltransferase [Persicimonas sp.]